MVPYDETLELRVDQLDASLRARLSPEDYRLVCKLRQAEELAAVAACVAWEERMLAALVRHFPDHDLAIRAVIAHVHNTHADCETFRSPGTPRPGA